VLLVNASLKHERITEVDIFLRQLIPAEVNDSRQIKIDGTGQKIYLDMIRLRRTFDQLLLGHNLLLSIT